MDSTSLFTRQVANSPLAQVSRLREKNSENRTDVHHRQDVQKGQSGHSQSVSQ